MKDRKDRRGRGRKSKGEGMGRRAGGIGGAGGCTGILA